MEHGHSDEKPQASSPDISGELAPPASTSDANIPPVPETPSIQETPAPMLDVHAPHETIHTWKDFFVHIATIVVGLLIAVGLEQTVEYFHHRHQVAEARAALDVELRVNLNRFEAETEVFRRHVPIVQTNLAVFQYLRQHPGAPATQWPGKIEWGGPLFPCSNDTWRAAQQSGVLEHMPPAEVRHYAAINRRCEELAGFVYARRAAIQRAYMYAIVQPDPSLLSPAQIDEEISLTTSVLLAWIASATAQNNAGRGLHEFSSAPTRAEILSLAHRKISPELERTDQALIDKVFAFEKRLSDEGDSH